VQSLTLGVLIIAVFLGVGKYLRPTLIEQFSSRAVGSAVGWLLALILSAPFLWALVHRTPAKAAFRRVFGQDRYRAPLFTLVVARWAIAIFVIGTLSTRFFNVWWSLLLAAALMLTVLVIFSRHLSGIYSWFAQQFSDNLSANGSAPAPVHAAPLAPWDAHLETLEVSPDSKLAGHTLMESRIRENFGVTIAMIERGSRRIAPPTQHDRLFPYDEISVIGTDDQIVKFRHAVESRRETELETTDSDYGLFPLRIGLASRFIGKSIRDSGIREEADALVVGVERGNERILNPDSSMSLLSGDLLWVVCDTKKARRL
ncbi:MAG: TrkA C-terminal domain-containing protein, partial [Bdellovibrionaceae bacterium]|nr:TrkA C-terminal domain-containing protein [Pseudobdellovibrionaceae bacterium]